MGRLLLLCALATTTGCFGSHVKADPTGGLRAEVRALSSENAWLHARLFEAEARLTAPVVATACSLPPEPPATTTRVFGDVRRALAAEIARGEVDVELYDDAVAFGLPLGIGFAGETAVFSPAGEAALERVAATLRRLPDVGVEIVTQVTGAPVIQLGDWQRAHARALALAWSLSDLGVSPDRITVVSRPVVPVASGPPATATVPREADVEVVLRAGPPDARVDQGPLLGVVR